MKLNNNNAPIYKEIQRLIPSFKQVSGERKAILQVLVDYIQIQLDNQQKLQLNFICTHNSRRSHLCQIWAQTAAAYYQINNINCYSGGTELSAIFPTVIETLKKHGLNIKINNPRENPIYKISFSDHASPIIGFSKYYDDDFNPSSNFAAIMTCTHADENCPTIIGSDIRIPIRYEDPKIFDGTPTQSLKYQERSIEIASEMFYIFSKINLND